MDAATRDERDSLIWELRYHAGRTHAQIAASVGCSRFVVGRVLSASVRDAYRVRNRARQAAASARKTALVLARYGQACACCGTADDLTIDHINGDGAAHRLALYGDPCAGTGDRFHRWLIANHFPPGYQVLCRRCGSSKQAGERCRLDHGGDE